MIELNVGFIGLGKMGQGMVNNLLKAGFYTSVYDIRKEPLGKMKTLGANVSGSSKEVALNSDVVISMVRDNAQTEQVLFGDKGVLEGMKKGCIIIMSTISPDFSKKHAPKLEKEAGVHLLDAPVSGGPMAADAGALSIMVGGEEGVFKQYLPIFKAMGKNIFYCGASGAGLVAKLTNNLIYAATMAGLSEAVALGLKEGIDLSVLLGIYKVSSAGCWAAEHYWDYVTPQRKDTGPDSNMEVLYKDLRLALKFATEKGVSMPITRFCSQLDLYDRVQS